MSEPAQWRLPQERLGELDAFVAAAAAPSWLHTDAAGRRFLKLPEPQALQRLAEGLTQLLGTLRERGA